MRENALIRLHIGFGLMGFYLPPRNDLMPPPTTGLGLLSGGTYNPFRLGAISPFAASVPVSLSWHFVRGRFTKLIENLAITEAQRIDGETKHAGVRACLNRHYWETSSNTHHSLLIGSWGKLTRVRPSRDVDILFLLPATVFHRYQVRSGNRQSQLLQEVKDVLRQTYSQTSMLRGDGQVVVIPFETTPIEVAPGFRCDDGRIIVCDTRGDGSYQYSTAEAEAADLAASDSRWNGNTRALTRMMKQWQRERNVPLKSFQLERLAIEFLQAWSFSHQDVFYYDWMVRDFLAYLILRANTCIVMPGTGEHMWLGNEWLSRAQTAYRYAVTACNYERDNYETLAGQSWQEIFGTAIPMVIW
jgi:hypothetical protein